MLRILLVDDHPVFRFGMRALLTSQPEVAEVCEAASGEEAIAQAAASPPDLILMDINLPDISGIETTRRILAENPQIGILILTMVDDDSVFEAIEAGARGYILKGADPEETLRAIRAAVSGSTVFSPAVAERLFNQVRASHTSQQATPFPELTAREREVLRLIAQGLTNAAIAEKLFLAPKTVRNHVSHIFAKLHVANRVEAIRRARQAGLHLND